MMMRSLLWRAFAVLGVALGLAGCGGTSSGPSGPTDAELASHKGQVMPIEGKGSVELVVEKDGSKGKVVAFFSNSDGSGPIDPAPSSVEFLDGSKTTYPMTVKPDAASKALRFETQSGPFAAGRQIDGQISASFGGEPDKVMFRGR